MTAPRHVTFTAKEGGQSFEAWHDTGSFTVTSGYAKLNTVDVPERASLTVFAGYDVITATLPLLFDQFGQASDGKIEAAINVLEWMSGRGSTVGGVAPTASEGVKETKPPHINVSANPALLIPAAYQGITWLVTGLAWGESIRDSKGNRQRQHVVVTLMEEHDPGPYKSGKNTPKPKQGWKKYKIRGAKDDTCTLLALNIVRTKNVSKVAKEILAFNKQKKMLKGNPHIGTKIKKGTAIWVPTIRGHV